MKLSKLEYAGRYDGMANELYRLNLLLLGDTTAAQRSMAEIFVQGFRLHEGERFEESMLRVTLKTAAEYPARFGEQYCRGLGQVAVGERLKELLCDMDFNGRAALLLTGFKLSNERIIALLGKEAVRAGQTVISACG